MPHADRLAAYRTRLPELHPQAGVYSVAVLEFGIRYEEAVLWWFDDVPAELRGDAIARAGVRPQTAAF